VTDDIKDDETKVTGF